MSNSEFWIICIQEQDGGHHLPYVSVVDASKLPTPMRDAYLACDGKSEEMVTNMALGQFNDDHQIDAFYKILSAAVVEFTENMRISKLLTYTSY